MEWRQLKFRPVDSDEEMKLINVSGNAFEFENRTGQRYRRVTKDGIEQWFSLRAGRGTRIEVVAEVAVCCKKFQTAFRKFIDRPRRNGPVCIFPKSDIRCWRYREISQCPFCGRKITFLKVSEVPWGRPRARTAQAGARLT